MYRRGFSLSLTRFLPRSVSSCLRPTARCAGRSSKTRSSSVVHGSYKAGKALNEEDGSRIRAVSPAAAVPPARTAPSTPDLNGGPISADESTCRLRPARKRSMRTQGVRRPGQLYGRRGSELDEGPERHPLEVQAGGVMFSPRSPAPISKPAWRSEAKSSDGIMCTCRRLGRRGWRRAR